MATFIAPGNWEWVIGDLLKSYPGLTAKDLVNAWDYAHLNADEIESQIRLNEHDD